MSQITGVRSFRRALAATALVIGCAVTVLASAHSVGAAEVSVRPSLIAACNAWRVHIADLIDQHRIAQEIDERALADIVRRFIAARNACTPGRYETGLRMYEDIPLGPVQGKLLK